MYPNKREDGVLTIELPDRIDSVTAADVEVNIMGIVDGGEQDSLILDAVNLVYISSAGLRIVLKLLKKIKNVSVVNVDGDIYDIFSLAGFTNMMVVEKKN
ncbi:MAG: STAS domain-containing protein [Eubacterium sp.]|nr:STAS domain-containing protein [Eubacterium sp.]